MKSNYPQMSFLFALLAIATTNTSYKDRAYGYYSKARDSSYKMKDTIVRKVKNNPGRIASIGLGLTAAYLARNRIRQAYNWARKKWENRSDRWRTAKNITARNQERQLKILEQEKEEKRKAALPEEEPFYY